MTDFYSYQRLKFLPQNIKIVTNITVVTCTYTSVLAMRYGKSCKILKPKNGIENYNKQKSNMDEISQLVSSIQQRRLSTLDLLMNKDNFSL